MRFTFARSPAILFGAGALARIDSIVSALAGNILLVTGAHSFRSSRHWNAVLSALERSGVRVQPISVEGEPSPDWVDEVTSRYRSKGIEGVVAIGGGSAMDAGKAVSAMLPCGGTVMDYLEGVGTGISHGGEKVPFVAVPTTAGTGSEATKNAVLSRVGAQGFKKSLRHEKFVPDAALIDPELLVSCPPRLTAVCGMDAFSQLLESYLSSGASPMTDALAWSGLESLCSSLLSACREGANDLEVRARTAYAALISGITLANAGLGTIHGLASHLGAAYPIPHGVACGTLMGALNAATMEKLHDQNGWEHPALKKYAKVGALMDGREPLPTEDGCRLFIEKTEEWIERLDIPRLGAYGIHPSDIACMAKQAGNKKNPIALEPHEIAAALEKRI
ncbi:MAG: iron-containing alcohol dehydrogenase [Planctomycetota bacterium]